MIIDIAAMAFMLSGLLFFTATAVGLIRFPDFFSRAHAAGKGDTLSTVLMLIGLALHSVDHLTLASVLIAGKLMLIGFFIFIASPTASHAIIDAAYGCGVKPWERDDDHSKRGDE